MAQYQTKKNGRRVDWSSEDVDLYEEYVCAQARESFWRYRIYMRPEMKRGWFLEHEAAQLQKFYDDYKAGRRPILVLSTPPQHGKTTSIVDFISWLFGHDPLLAIIFTSFSDERGTTVNGQLQRIMASPRYAKVFSKTVLPTRGDKGYSLNSDFFQLKRIKSDDDTVVDIEPGSFRNTTVRGAITGQALKIGFIDDPVKGRAEVSSQTNRDMLWNWFIDDFFTRFADNAAMVMVMTRWHVDDPAGRTISVFGDRSQQPNRRAQNDDEILEAQREALTNFANLTVLNYQAIATGNDWSVRKGLRRVGDALFPEFKSKAFLLARKVIMTIGSWLSLYQGSPIVVGGGDFPIEKFELIVSFDRRKIKKSVRYWDKAGTEGGSGSETAGVLMHEMMDDYEHPFVIEHVAHGRWSALRRESIIKQMCQIDNRERRVETWVEQEPGSGGKESAEATIRKLRGFRVYADRVTGSKESRAEPYAAQVQGGNVALLMAEWNNHFLDQHESWPNAKLKDIVDGSAGAFAKLVVGESTYDTSMSWVGTVA